MAQKTPFDHINAILTNQKISYFDELSDSDRKTFTPYVINMGLSMTAEFLPVVNEANKYWDQLDQRSLYLFYSQILPKGKRYSKWVKSTKKSDYEPWLVDKIARHFEVSRDEAEYYLDRFYKTDSGRAELKSLLEGYGLEPKQLKKVKL